MTTNFDLIAINVGNSRTHLGRTSDGELGAGVHFTNNNLPRIVQKVVTWWQEIEEKPTASIVMASVNDQIANRLASAIEKKLNVEIFRIGDEMPVPIGTQLDPETITGIDRLLNAAAAYDLLKQACVIVDVGTAVTVDFVDGEGTFHGGAIAPGAALQLRALHEYTEALPELDFKAPDDEAFGRSTTQAMLQGVFHGIQGLVWKLVEQYAEDFGAFPTVIATGGDAEVIFGEDELVDRIVGNLTMQGIFVTARTAMLHPADEDVDVMN